MLESVYSNVHINDMASSVLGEHPEMSLCHQIVDNLLIPLTFTSMQQESLCILLDLFD